MLNPGKMFPRVLVLMLLASALMACGDPTATPVVATTAASTTSATTAVSATTAQAQTATQFTIPAVADLTEVTTLPQSDMNLLGQAAQRMSSAMPSLAFKIYVSDDERKMVTTNLDKALTGADYKAALPGQPREMARGNGSISFYTKTGSPDLQVNITDGPTTITPPAANSGVTPPPEFTDLLNMLKTKKTAVIIYAAPGLAENVIRQIQAASATPTK
jgi:hypothetical protein